MKFQITYLENGEREKRKYRIKFSISSFYRHNYLNLIAGAGIRKISILQGKAAHRSNR